MSENFKPWIPTAAADTQLAAFMNKAHKTLDAPNYDAGQSDNGYHEFWQWSVEHAPDFWELFWDEAGIIGEKGDITLKNPDKMTGAQYFDEGTLNYAQNLLQRRDDFAAIIFRDEKGGERTLTYAALYDAVSCWAQYFKSMGITQGELCGQRGRLPIQSQRRTGKNAEPSTNGYHSLY